MHFLNRHFLIRFMGVAVMAMTVVMGSFNVAQAAQVCQSADGALVVRKKCKKAESKFSAGSLSIAIAGTSGPVGPQGQQGIAGIQGPVGSQGPLGAPGAAGGQGVTGLKGAPGRIDFSGCRKIQATRSNLLNPATGTLTVQLSCDPFAEFLFHDSFSASPFPPSVGTTVFLQSREIGNFTVAGDTRTTDSYITFERINAVNGGAYSLSATGLCCPR